MTKKKIILFVCIVICIVALIGVAINFGLSKKNYEVTFYSDDDTVIKVDEVPRNDSADPPVTPQVPYGKIFSHWSTDFSKVKGNMDIKPVCENFIGKSNVFAMSGAYGKKDSSVTVPLQLCGNVCLSGFDITVKYDSDVLELDSVFNEDGGIVYNSERPGQIKINYVSTKNTLGDVDICCFKFKIKSDEKKDTPIEISAGKVCAVKDDESIYDAEYSIINSSVYIIG